MPGHSTDILPVAPLPRRVPPPRRVYGTSVTPLHPGGYQRLATLARELKPR